MFKKIILGVSVLLFLYYRSFIIASITYAITSCIATLCLILLTTSTYVITPATTVLKKYYKAQHIYSDNQQLRQKNKELQRELIVARSLVYEAKITQPLAEFAERYKGTLIGVHVIGRTLSDHLQLLMLNKGSVHGIHKDMVGIWYNCCIGKVYEVHPYSSTLLLITDARCMVPGVSLPSKVHGIIRGLNKQSTCAFDYVEHTKMLEPGMPIMTSGEGTIFPQGFGIGKLSTAIKRSLYYEAFIELSYTPQDIEYCYIGSKAMIEHGI